LAERLDLPTSGLDDLAAANMPKGTIVPRIACIGWGSLCWDPRELPITGGWRNDGPFVRVEFLRRSKDGRITLVLDESAVPVPALWTLLNVADVKAATLTLQAREGIPLKNIDSDIGVWTAGGKAPPLIEALPKWAEERELDAVVWTNLPRKFHPSGRRAEVEEIIDYLQRLTGPKRDAAEQYVRKAPAQISTAYRAIIAAALGWTPLTTGDQRREPSRRSG